MTIKKDEDGNAIVSIYGMSYEKFDTLDELGKVNQLLISWHKSQSEQIIELKEDAEIYSLAAQVGQAQETGELAEHSDELDQKFAQLEERDNIPLTGAERRSGIKDALTWMLQVIEKNNIHDTDSKTAVIASAAISSHSVTARYLNDGLFSQALLNLRNTDSSLRMWRDLVEQRVPFKEAKSETARSGGLARLTEDPEQAAKQEAKKSVFLCWQDWQKSKTPENPKGTYKDNTAFANDMLDKYDDVLKSQVVITRWCTTWSK